MRGRPIRNRRLNILAKTISDGFSLDFEYQIFLQNSIPEEMAGLRRCLLMGASFTAEGATAWFSNFAYHDVATSLAAVHAALLKAYNPIANIDVYNYPLQANYREQVIILKHGDFSYHDGTSSHVMSIKHTLSNEFYFKFHLMKWSSKE